jgi:methyltransferase family protein
VTAAPPPGDRLGARFHRGPELQAGLSNAAFSVANISDLDLPAGSFDVAHFSGVLMYLKQPEQALQLAFRSLKRGGMLAAREAQKGGDWFAGPGAESIALFFSMAIEGHKRRGGDPFLGRRLAGLVHEAGFERLDTRPSYSVALSDVRATATTMLAALGRPDFRTIALESGLSEERLDRLGDEISTWADSQDSIAASPSARSSAGSHECPPPRPTPRWQLDDGDAPLAAEGNRTVEVGEHGPSGRRLHRGAGCDEVVLHVHDNQGCPGWVQPIDLVWHRSTSSLSWRAASARQSQSPSDQRRRLRLRLHRRCCAVLNAIFL